MTERSLAEPDEGNMTNVLLSRIAVLSQHALCYPNNKSGFIPTAPCYPAAMQDNYKLDGSIPTA